MPKPSSNGNQDLSRRAALGLMGGAAAGASLAATDARDAAKKAAPAGHNERLRAKGRFVRGRGPNILLVMADQHRADWMGCAGAEWVKTPNLDRLAANGVLFRQAACNAPLCAPSRSALASGLRPRVVDVLNNGKMYPPNVPTYFQALRAAGYRVGCVGKMDLHKPDHWEGKNGDRPLMYHLGFTDLHETEGKQSAAMDFGEPVCPYQHMLAERGLFEAFQNDYGRTRHTVEGAATDSVLPLDAYHDSYIGDHACDYLSTVSDESPWHYFVSFVGPHNPWDAPPLYAEPYRDAAMPRRIPSRKTYGTNGKITPARELPEELVTRAMREYAGMITLIDDYVGRMLAILKERGMLENTMVVYCADHGEMMGDYGRFYKGCYYEAALRIPLIMSGAGVAARGVSDQLVELYDLAPTCLDLAQTEPLAPMTAKSLVPLLQGATEPIRAFQVSELDDSRMIYDGRFKLNVYSGEPLELYDIVDDPKESTNLVENRAHKKTVAQLMKALAKA